MDFQNYQTQDFTKLISFIIDQKISSIVYNQEKFTFQIKYSILEAFKTLLISKNQELINYLIFKKRSYLQHLIFQESVKILENKIPYNFTKRNKLILINSLENTGIFFGEGLFKSSVNKNSNISNNSELYNGKKFFIGKILDITDLWNTSLMNQVISYDFNQIQTTLLPRKDVKIKFLKLIPNYQHGMLLHINNIKKELCDSLKYSL